ncbi:MAG: type II toxin-antitoxin system RelB/DinJ family antitoxin [Clostridium sp.]|nr:type II toxin-antitoxin system RelB/DinJ family antitoxin [Clostridium sp.]
MANETTNVTVRMDKDLKEQAESLFAEMGMNLTTALNIFVRQSVRQRKIPFEIAADPFYSVSNIKYLESVISDIEAGRSNLVEHDLIEG